MAWICISHRGRFIKPGDYVSTEVAGFRIFPILGEDGVARAFHNGTHQGAAFRQYTWLNKSGNSLWQIHTKIDDAGFIRINYDRSLEAGKSPLPHPVKNGNPVIIYQASQYPHSWEIKRGTSWKIMVAHSDNYDVRENSHLIETGILASTDVTPSLEINHMSQLRFGFTTFNYTKRGSPFWFLVIYSPDSAGQTTLRWEAYSVKRQSTPLSKSTLQENWGGQLRFNVQELERVHRGACMDGYRSSNSICMATSLTAVDSPTHASMADGQDLIAEQVDAHLAREEAEGREIDHGGCGAVQSHWDLLRQKGYAKPVAVCQAVECAASGKLDW
ncbi:uncharacterized protein BDV17DRAFT_290274 [Aspergillus undulatus]|uniref:uncharacterized protein n=1 Tax=Aspergillus undulatus TaxID=1810928 RepID=UPI003CCE231F